MAQIIKTDKAPAAVGPYSQAIKTAPGTMIFCSGQIALDPSEGKLMGVTAAEQADRVLKNLEAVLVAAGAEMKHVVKTTLYLTAMSDFGAVNEVYARYFTMALPARATVEVARLPKEAKVMIDAIAMV